MSIPTTPCCVVSLNHQREQTIQHHKQCNDVQSSSTPSQHTTKNCTVVENGLVVVKPLPASSVTSDQ